MLDLFLQATYDKTKEAEAERREIELLRKLPDELLCKMAMGLEKLAYGELKACSGTGEDETWLGRFKGTPLFAEALEIEKKELEMQMASKQQSDAQSEVYRQQDSSRQELNIQRKLLDLKLAEGDGGAGVVDPMLEGAGQPVEEVPEADPAVAAPVAAKPPVKTEEKKPAAEPASDVKVAAARMKLAFSMQQARGAAARGVELLTGSKVKKLTERADHYARSGMSLPRQKATLKLRSMASKEDHVVRKARGYTGVTAGTATLVGAGAMHKRKKGEEVKTAADCMISAYGRMAKEAAPMQPMNRWAAVFNLVSRLPRMPCTRWTRWEKFHPGSQASRCPC